MSPSSIDVVVAGHICLDVIPSFPAAMGRIEFADLFRPGKLTQVERAVMSSGGPVSNTGIALLILGMNVELMGKVGDDYFAQGLLDLLARRGLDKSMVRVPGEQTSYTLVLAPPGIDRMFLHCPGANNTYGADDVNYEIASRARVFHLGYPPLMKRLYANDGEQLAEIYRRLKTHSPSVATSLDMALPDPTTESGRISWRRVLEKTLPYVDLYLPSAEETLFMLDREKFLSWRDQARKKRCDILDLFTADDLSAMADELLAMGGKIITIKCGVRGMYCRTAGCETMSKVPQLGPDRLDNWTARELWRSSYHVDPVVSATGSGDSSIAGFLAAFLRGSSFEKTLDFANAVGGCNVTAMDAISGIRSWEATNQLLSDGWTNNPLEVKGRGWRPFTPGVSWSGPHESVNESS